MPYSASSAPLREIPGSEPIRPFCSAARRFYAKPDRNAYFPPWFFATHASYSTRGIKRSEALLMQ